MRLPYRLSAIVRILLPGSGAGSLIFGGFAHGLQNLQISLSQGSVRDCPRLSAMTGMTD